MVEEQGKPLFWGALGELRKINAPEIADSLEGDVGLWILGTEGCIIGVVPLRHKDRRDTIAPLLFQRRKDLDFVVNKDVVRRWVVPLNVCDLILFVDVDQYSFLKNLLESRACDLVWLIDPVTIRNNNRSAKGLDGRNRVECMWIEARWEWIVQEPI